MTDAMTSGTEQTSDNDLVQVPQGFEVSIFAEGLSGVRMLKLGPDDRLYTARSSAGEILRFDLNADGTFNNPSDKWAGLMRKVETNDFDLHKVTSFRADSGSNQASDWRADRRWYAGMTTFWDECVGNVTGKLEAKGMYDDTLIVLTSDHGWGMGEKD